MNSREGGLGEAADVGGLSSTGEVADGDEVVSRHAGG